MSDDLVYRCLNCLEETVSRDFDVSHLSRTCSTCGSFQRFVNEVVYEQFQAFEASPPEDVDWEDLDREEKLLVSERVTRSNRSIEDFERRDG